MKMRVSLIIALAMLMAFVPAALANDLGSASTWAREGIASATEKGFVPADLQEDYQKVITRAEFCRMAVKWLEYRLGSSFDHLDIDGLSFEDTSETAILVAFALGITAGVGNNRFDPDGQFNREQAAAMIMNTMIASGADVPKAPPSGFMDINAASGWAVPGINYVRFAGVMAGTGGNNFSPKELYTREQSIVTFNNILETYPDTSVGTFTSVTGTPLKEVKDVNFKVVYTYAYTQKTGFADSNIYEYLEYLLALGFEIAGNDDDELVDTVTDGKVTIIFSFDETEIELIVMPV